eukprot:431044-Alexandrium_andersonii.AAC.1
MGRGGPGAIHPGTARKLGPRGLHHRRGQTGPPGPAPLPRVGISEHLLHPAGREEDHLQGAGSPKVERGRY